MQLALRLRLGLDTPEIMGYSTSGSAQGGDAYES
jgi:hypothetical protein